MISRAVMIKAIVGAFVGGILIGALPTALAVHSLWNGAAKNKTIRVLKEDVSDLELSARLAEKSKQVTDEINKSVRDERDDLRKENSRLTEANAKLAASRAATNSQIITQGQGLKNEVSKTDKCARTDIDERLRLFANGESSAPS